MYSWAKGAYRQGNSLPNGVAVEALQIRIQDTSEEGNLPPLDLKSLPFTNA